MSHKDEFAKMFDGDEYNSRFENWLCHYMINGGFNPDRNGPADFRDAAAKYISHKSAQDPLNAERIKQTYKQAAVNEEQLKWIDDDPWLNRWIRKQVWVKALFVRYSLTERDRTILLIDSSTPPNNQDKETAINDLKRSWASQIAEDKKYQWFFDKHKEAKLLMLTDWAKKHTNPFQQFQEPVDVLEFFYPKPGFNYSDAKLCFDAIKKRWSQTKYRKGLEKKKKQQCNLVLPEESLKSLDAMAHRHKVSRARILEILIDFEAEHKHYLPLWIKRLGDDHRDEDTTLSSSK